MSTEPGIVAWGNDLSVETLKTAYAQGVFPWPVSADLPIPWFCPPERAILDFKDLHVGTRLKRYQKNHPFRLTIDQAFEDVIRNCSSVPRKSQGPQQNLTWITPSIEQAYIQLHKQGIAHSIEVWREKKLVGGLYGVFSGNYFSAESMFHLEPNTSKLALLHLIENLRTIGITWIDIQVLTDHMKKLGAKLISRSRFLNRLEQSRHLNLQFPSENI